VAKSWKAVERAIAAHLGGERVPVTGRVRGYAPDVEHPTLAIEVKSWANYPVRVADAMDQAVKAAEWALKKGKGIRVPIAVIHKDYAPYDKSFVVMHLEDFEALAKLPGGPLYRVGLLNVSRKS
jgi:hypothetical protein